MTRGNALPPSDATELETALVARRAITSHPARDLLLYGFRLLGHRARQCPKVMPRVVELIDQGENDRQARMVEPHAVVQVAGQRYT